MNTTQRNCIHFALNSIFWVLAKHEIAFFPLLLLLLLLLLFSKGLSLSYSLPLNIPFFFVSLFIYFSVVFCLSLMGSIIFFHFIIRTLLAVRGALKIGIDLFAIRLFFFLDFFFGSISVMICSLYQFKVFIDIRELDFWWHFW